MIFRHPAWLIAGLAACIGLLLLWRRYDVRQHAALANFVSAHLRASLTQSVSAGRRRLQRVLMLAAVAFLFIALAEPLLGFRWEMVNRRGIQVMFAIDTSRSMSTPDVKPDRLTRSKLAIDDFTRKLDGDAVGLIAFAGDAFVICPETLDYGAFHESLNAIDTGTIPRGGTNISMAIGEARAALGRRAVADRILILVTDGENLEGDALSAAKEAGREDGFKIYTVGVGTGQGDLIPLGPDSTSGFLKDESGNFVRSKLDEPALKAIAAATGGMYAPLGAAGQGLETIYRESLAPLLKHDLASRQQRVYIERYQWPLSAALALLLASQLVGNRRRVRRRHKAASPGVATSGVRTHLGLALLLAVAGLCAPPHVGASPSSAQQAYERGDFAAAAREYAEQAKRDPKEPTFAYDLGTAQYRAGEFAQAAQAFQESINRAPSGDAKRLADQEDAYYNLGNTLYRAGQKTEDGNPRQTLDNWKQAVKAYETALAMRPNDGDSKYNRDYVKRKIDELEKKQQNNPQNQPNQNQQNQNQQGQGQSQGGGGQGSPNQPQNQPPQNQPPQNQPPQNQGQNQQPPKDQGQNPPPDQKNPPSGSRDPSKQGQNPPQNSGQPPKGSPQNPPPPGGQPKPADGQSGGRAQDGQAQRVPGQMTPEEARQLLDSQKGDERSALGIPYARRGGETPPEKPVKDW